MPEKLHSPAEAAAILGISVKTLREHVKFGRIRSIKVGGGIKRPRRMFTHKNIETFIENQKERLIPPCPSTSPKNLHIIHTTSNTGVIGFTALQKLKASGKPLK